MTTYHTKYIFKKLEKDSVVNVGTLLQEIQGYKLRKEHSNDEDKQYVSMTLNGFH